MYYASSLSFHHFSPASFFHLLFFLYILLCLSVLLLFYPLFLVFPLFFLNLTSVFLFSILLFSVVLFSNLFFSFISPSISFLFTLYFYPLISSPLTPHLSYFLLSLSPYYLISSLFFPSRPFLYSLPPIPYFFSPLLLSWSPSHFLSSTPLPSFPLLFSFRTLPVICYCYLY